MKAQKSKTSQSAPRPHARSIASEILQAVLLKQRSLADVTETRWARLTQQGEMGQKDKALAQTLVYGVLRFLPTLRWFATQLLKHPLKAKDQDLQILLYLGLYQLWALRVPPHAAISTTVELSRSQGKPWASGLVNAVLRNFQRQQTELLARVEQDENAYYAHPKWWLKAWKQAWPNDWQALALANNEAGPMTLRVNLRQQSRAEYINLLTAQGLSATPLPHNQTGLQLDKPLDVQHLPRFAEGAVSVQDGAAQWAADLLDAPSDGRILDACAAPGGKTAHILERCPDAEVWALDADAQRLKRVDETLSRLQLKTPSVHILCGDAAEPDTWWDGKPFSHILLDAPCSASGVIRRHPDIKYLRKAADMSRLAALQKTILNRLWALLAPNGILLYATCSVMPEENSLQLDAFLLSHADAQVLPFTGNWGHAQSVGRQILPNEAGMDGFYYARLQKKSVHVSN